MMKPTPCKSKGFTASGYSGSSASSNPRARLLSFSIQTTYNLELSGQYISFRNNGASGGILFKWEFGLGTSGTNPANLFAFNCVLPGGGILFPDGIYVDFSQLDDSIGTDPAVALTWRVNMVYQA